LPRTAAFMHEEARDVLPRVLDAAGFRRGLLVGHSDGASIAAIYAGSIQDHRVRGLALMAPHFFTEDMGIAEIARAKVAFEQGNLRAKLARLHADPDNAFHNWCDPWLLPAFRKWDLSDALAHIRVPVLIVQGENDQYGTVKQIEVAQAECYCPVEVALLPDTRHAPYREAPAATLAAISDFANRLLRDHHEGDIAAHAAE
jgi:pimeloyl-ACP methyl ester carboxylesterase